MNDPWADVRKRLRHYVYADAKHMNYLDAPELRAFLADADALLAVKEAAKELSLAMRVIDDWKAAAITRRIDRLAKALGSLPEHLK